MTQRGRAAYSGESILEFFAGIQDVIKGYEVRQTVLELGLVTRTTPSRKLSFNIVALRDMQRFRTRKDIMACCAWERGIFSSG